MSNDVTERRGSNVGDRDVRVRHADLVGKDVSIQDKWGSPSDLK